jgi:hypothetical protein
MTVVGSLVRPTESGSLAEGRQLQKTLLNGIRHFLFSKRSISDNLLLKKPIYSRPDHLSKTDEYLSIDTSLQLKKT